MLYLLVSSCKLIVNVCSQTGLLLREIKEFWHVVLLLSMQLYPVDMVSSTSFSNENFEMDKRSGLFKTVENAVRTLGIVISVLAQIPFFNIPYQSLFSLSYLISVFLNE